MLLRQIWAGLAVVLVAVGGGLGLSRFRILGLDRMCGGRIPVDTGLVVAVRVADGTVRVDGAVARWCR